MIIVADIKLGVIFCPSEQISAKHTYYFMFMVDRQYENPIHWSYFPTTLIDN